MLNFFYFQDIAQIVANQVLKFGDSSCNGMNVISNLKMEDGGRKECLKLIGSLKRENGNGRGLAETGGDEQNETG